ncbi:MAG: hypothetical protein ACOY5F_18770 [Pseudomonadota bacterium]
MDDYASVIMHDQDTGEILRLIAACKAGEPRIEGLQQSNSSTRCWSASSSIFDSAT